MTERKKKKAAVNRDLCVACGCCAKVCPMGALSVYCGLYAAAETGASRPPGSWPTWATPIFWNSAES